MPEPEINVRGIAYTRQWGDSHRSISKPISPVYSFGNVGDGGLSHCAVNHRTATNALAATMTVTPFREGGYVDSIVLPVMVGEVATVDIEYWDGTVDQLYFSTDAILDFTLIPLRLSCRCFTVTISGVGPLPGAGALQVIGSW